MVEKHKQIDLCELGREVQKEDEQHWQKVKLDFKTYTLSLLNMNLDHYTMNWQ